MQHLVIDARRGFNPSLSDLFNYRDLFLTLAYRDIKVRYAQTFLGFLWAFLQPAAALAIFTVVFGQAIRVPTSGIPYPLFAMAGMVPWTYFAFITGNVSGSIIAAQNMVQKTYFPRLLIPLSKAAVGLVDLAVAAAFYLILAAYFRWTPSWALLYLPVFLAICFAAALGAGIWLSALSVRFRDFQHVVPFIVQIGLYVTPVAYPASIIPARYRALYYLNPMAGVVEGFRWCVTGGDPPGPETWLSAAVAVLLFASSIAYFRRVERVMADLI